MNDVSSRERAIIPAVTVRKLLFWIHLTAGTVAGLVILVMSLTGLLIAFEPQIVDFAEQDLRNVSPPGPEARRLSIEIILAKAREAFSKLPPSGVAMRSEPASSAAVSFGREETIFVNPYTGDLLGKGSKTHKLMHEIEDWHRWLGSREIGKPVTGICNAAFLILVVTGFYLWWPRGRSGAAFRSAVLFNPRLQGKARDRNRHLVIGFWCAPVLLVITLTGLIMSYPWANNLLYTLTGNEPPPPVPQVVTPARSSQPPIANIDALWARAEQQAPGWVSIRLRFPQQPEAPVTAFIQERGSWHPNPRSQLILDPETAQVIRWEPFSEYNLGRRLRAWVRPIHTGEGIGWVGQLIVSLAAAGSALLVWTGLVMGWKRLIRRKASRSETGAAVD
ncbi:MAG: PepSY-associated TM helix domain-containing protein [Candidatus Manganitrophaceae bacterium]